MDPSRLLPEISDFKRALHVFFVQGYFLCDDGGSACVDDAAKTLAQIALEAVLEPLVLRRSVRGERGGVGATMANVRRTQGKYRGRRPHHVCAWH